MTTFEVGKKYYDTSACDHNCVFTVEIVKRTAQTVTFRRNGKERRAKIYTDPNGEFIIPDGGDPRRGGAHRLQHYPVPRGGMKNPRRRLASGVRFISCTC